MKQLKNAILILGCFAILITSMVQGKSMTGVKVRDAIAQCECSESNKHEEKPRKGGMKECILKELEEGNFEDAKKKILEHLDSKIAFLEKEMGRFSGEEHKDKLEKIQGKLEKVKELREKINSAQSKNEVKKLLSKEFSHKKEKCKDKR